jgi:hypothetical protein
MNRGVDTPSAPAEHEDISPFPPTPRRHQPQSLVLAANNMLPLVGSGSDKDPPFQQFGCLDIPYSSSTIITSPATQSINCFVYVPLRILVCYVCKIAVAPSRVLHHRRSLPHLDRCPTQDFVKELSHRHNLFERDYFEQAEAPKGLVPGIP